MFARRERLIGCLLIAAFLISVLIVLPRRPINHIDFGVYSVSTLAWLDGKNPYMLSAQEWAALASRIGSPYQERLPFFYSPVSLLLFLPFTLLTTQVGFPAGGYAWDVFKLFLLAWTMWRARRWIDLSLEYLIIITLLWLPLISDFALGQINILSLAIFCTALSLSDRGQGLLLGIGFHFKGLLLAPLGALLVRRKFRAFAWGLVGLIGLAVVFALADLQLTVFYFTQKFLPFLLAPVLPLTDPDLIWLVQSSHLSFPTVIRLAGLAWGIALVVLARQDAEALVIIAGAGVLFSGASERGHLLLLLPTLWLLVQAWQSKRLSAVSLWIGLLGFIVFTFGNVSSLVTVDLPRLLNLPTSVSPIAFAEPILSLGALLIWSAYALHISQLWWRNRQRVAPVGPSSTE